MVPNYQRTYKWEPDVAADLFQDIVEGLKLRQGGESGSCFLGSIVLSDDRNGGVTDLVDGQQRLTTLCLLIRCLSRHGDPDSAAVKNGLNLLGTPGSPVILHKPMSGVDCDDRQAFRECALSESPNLMPFGKLTTKESTVRNRLWKRALEAHYIYKASKALDECLGELAKLRGVSIKRTAEEALGAIIEGIKLVIINTDERKEGMRVFASINASGTKLEPWELVMSAFYSHAPSAAATKATETFFEVGPGSIAQALADKDRAEEDSKKNELLRSHWIAKSGYVSKDDLFDAYNEHLSESPLNHAAALAELSNSLRCHRAFTDLKYRHSAGLLDFEFFAPLQILSAKLCRPALIATAKLFDDPKELTDAMQRVAFFFEKVHMRWKITDKRTNTIDRPLATIAAMISSRQLGADPRALADNIEAAFKSLVTNQPSRGEFLLGVQAHNMTKELRLGNVIFQRLSHAVKHPSNSDRKLDHRFVPIYDTASRYKKGIDLMINQYDLGIERYAFQDRAHFAALIYSLGNCFAASGARYDDKAEINNGYRISELNAEDLDKRCKVLAEVAADIWHF